jgi:hypothetical protein
LRAPEFLVQRPSNSYIDGVAKGGIGDRRLNRSVLLSLSTVRIAVPLPPNRRLAIRLSKAGHLGQAGKAASLIAPFPL